MIWTDFSYCVPWPRIKSPKLDPKKKLFTLNPSISASVTYIYLRIKFSHENPLGYIQVIFWVLTPYNDPTNRAFMKPPFLKNSEIHSYYIKGLAKLRFAPFCSLRGRSHYRLDIQVLYSILLILFFLIFRLRIYTLYVIFTSYGLYPWKSSLRSPIKIFSSQSHFTIWVLSQVYVIYGENS